MSDLIPVPRSGGSRLASGYGERLRWSRKARRAVVGVLRDGERLSALQGEPAGEKAALPGGVDDDFWTRIILLRHDAKSDDLMAGVPRYQPRYTQREQEIVHLLGLGIDDLMEQLNAAKASPNASGPQVNAFDCKDADPPTATSRPPVPVDGNGQ